MAKSRLLFVDNLRTLMIVLVILVHLSITYGGEGSWFYKERPADTLTITVLSFFNAVTQSYFMGLLFLLAAYFTPGAYDRKGPRQFLRDRLLRLGIPLLVYEFVIHPLQAYPLIKAGALDLDGSFGELLVGYYTSFHIGSGPLWFVETLLIFAVLYAILRLAHKPAAKVSDDPGRLPGPGAILIFGATLGVLTFAVRLRLPISWALGFLNLQLPFFVQYIAMLIIGVIAYRRDWLVRLPQQAGKMWLALAGVLIFIVFPVLFTAGGALRGDVAKFLGGCHWQAFAYAMWEQITGVTVMVGLIVLFRERFNRQGRLTKEASASSYATYILHAPALILFTLGVRNIAIYPLLKFALVSLVLVPLCFALGAGLRRLPLARQIL
ncbi:MAG: acyltransferase family protein [Phycisphaerales bacterium]|nr:MAG: acyltransferase family protein [Phycisphaerales bacterium]